MRAPIECRCVEALPVVIYNALPNTHTHVTTLLFGREIWSECFDSFSLRERERERERESERESEREREREREK